MRRLLALTLSLAGCFSSSPPKPDPNPVPRPEHSVSTARCRAPKPLPEPDVAVPPTHNLAPSSVNPSLRASTAQSRGETEEAYRVAAPATVLIRARSVVGDQEVASFGSGIVIDPAGWILTNNHVVDSAPSADLTLRVEVELGERAADGSMHRRGRYPATVYKVDRVRDLALVKLDTPPADLVALRLAQRVPSPGSPVLCIGQSGNGLVWAAKAGSLAAAGTMADRAMFVGFECRASLGETCADATDVPPTRYIQSSCGIAQGDSGGPIVDMRGDLIGVNVLFIAQAKGAPGMYHVHLDEVRAFLASVPDHPPTFEPAPWALTDARVKLLDADDDGHDDTLVASDGEEVRALLIGDGAVPPDGDADALFGAQQIPAAAAIAIVGGRAYLYTDRDTDGCFDELRVRDERGKVSLFRYDAGGRPVPSGEHAEYLFEAGTFPGGAPALARARRVFPDNFTAPDPATDMAEALAFARVVNREDRDGDGKTELVMAFTRRGPIVVYDLDEAQIGNADEDATETWLREGARGAELLFTEHDNELELHYDVDGDGDRDLILMSPPDMGGIVGRVFTHDAQGWRSSRDLLGQLLVQPQQFTIPAARNRLLALFPDLAQHDTPGFPAPLDTADLVSEPIADAALEDAVDLYSGVRGEMIHVKIDGKVALAYVNMQGMEWAYYDTDVDGRFDAVLVQRRVVGASEPPTVMAGYRRSADAFVLDPALIGGALIRPSLYPDAARRAVVARLGGAVFAADALEVADNGGGVGTRGDGGVRRCALLVGVSNYETASIAPGGQRWPEIHGPANDVVAMKRALGRFDFDSIETLTDARATTTGVIAAIDELSRCVRGSDDVALFYYAGHGASIPDQSGAGRDENDGCDEAIVLSDNRGTKDPAFTGYLRDEQIYEALGRIKATKNVVLIFDSCHSGSATRGDGTVARGTVQCMPTNGARPALGAFVDDVRPGTVALVAAQSNELALEAPVLDGTCKNCSMGAFTRTLVTELDTIAPNASYQSLVKRVQARMDAESLPQHAGVRGASDKILFGGAGAASRPGQYTTAPIANGDDHVHIIDGGLLTGLAVGSVLAVASDDQAVTEPIARLRVDTVGLVDAWAVLANGDDARPGQSLSMFGAPRASKVDPSKDPNVVYRVTVDADAKGVADALGGMSFLKLTTGNDWNVRIGSGKGLAPCSGAQCGDAQPCSANDLATGIVLRRHTGGLVPIPTGPDSLMDECLRAGTDPKIGAARIAAAFEVDVRRTRLRQLMHGDGGPSESGIRVKAVVERDVTATWAPRGYPTFGGADAPITAGGDESARVCAKGANKCDRTRVEVTNNGGKPLYLTVFVLMPDGAIQPLMLGTSEMVVPAHDSRIVAPYGGVAWKPPAGKYEIRVIALDVPDVDLSALGYDVIRFRGGDRLATKAPRGDSPLAGLLQFLTGATRGFWDALPIADWGTDVAVVQVE